MISLGLLTFLLSNASWVPAIVSVLVLGAYVAFLPLMIRGVRASVAGAKAALRAGAPVRVNIERPARPAAPSGVGACRHGGHPCGSSGQSDGPENLPAAAGPPEQDGKRNLYREVPPAKRIRGADINSVSVTMSQGPHH